MGAACCCFHVAEPADNSNASDNGGCFCFSSFFHIVCNKYKTLMGRDQRQAPVSNVPITNNTQSEGITSAPRIFPFDADSQEDGLFARHEDEADPLNPLHFHKSSSQLRRSNSQDTEDEDVCPTCLEEYTIENPMIVTKCSHHFHLSCIYEWMERKPTCPICSKEMKFEELN